VTGGWDREFVSKEVETFEGNYWSTERMANLPATTAAHCLVKINSSTLMLIGGLTDNFEESITGNTYFFNVLDNEWISGPTLQTPRVIHSCGILHWNNLESGEMEDIVVVAGEEDLSSVELLKLNVSEPLNLRWEIGPNLPFQTYGSPMIEYQGSVIIVGGDEQSGRRHLYQLSSPVEPWVLMKQTLKYDHFLQVSFFVPDELVNCY
jgi:hypothetical protein